MLYLALRMLSEYKIIDLENDDLQQIEFSNSKAKLINETFYKNIINGLNPGQIDLILGLTIANRLTVTMDKNLTDMLWNNSDLLSNILNKKLKKLVFWLNEYLDINDVYALNNYIVNFLIMKLKNDTIAVEKSEFPLYKYLSKTL